MADPDKPYKVGYAKPPTHTQFSKGKSGNPKGRPKKRSAPLTAAIEKVFDEHVGSIEVNGTTKTLTGRDAMYRGLAAAGLRGDVKAIKRLLSEHVKLTADHAQALGVEQRRKDSKAGGIMVVPAIMELDAWEAMAVQSQEALSKASLEDQ